MKTEVGDRDKVLEESGERKRRGKRKKHDGEDEPEPEPDRLWEALRRRKRQAMVALLFKNPMKFVHANPLRLGYISAAIGASLIMLIYHYSMMHDGWSGFVAPFDAYILAGIAAITPTALYFYVEDRRTRKADDEFPGLLRDLAQAKRAGLTLVDSVLLTSEGNYGVLTTGLRTVAYQLTWGVPFEDALRMFAKRYPTEMIKRSVEIIIEGYRVGGDVGEILKIAADDVNEQRSLERKRAADMGPYVAICYITFGVFLLILLVLYKTLIPMMTEAAKQITGAGMGRATIVNVDTERMKMILFHCGIIQGICSGLVAGKLGEGKIIAGLKHALLMASGSFALFAVLKLMPNFLQIRI